MLNITRALNLVPVHFENDVSLLQSSVIGRAAGLNLLDYRSVQAVGGLELISNLWRQIFQAETPTRLARTLRLVTTLIAAVSPKNFAFSGVTSEIPIPMWPWLILPSRISASTVGLTI